jgi:hypothetical protein
MLILPGLFISIVGLMFGIYQWKKQRGNVGVELVEMQTRIYLRVCANSPIQITVRDIGYEVRSKRLRLDRFLSQLRRNDDSYHRSLWRRIRFAWTMRNFIAFGWCEPVPTDENEQSVIFPLSGPPLPLKIDGYDDQSWEFDTRLYADLFDSINTFAAQNPRLRFIVRVSGHPRREVKSKWLRIENMEAFSVDNAWLFKSLESGQSDKDIL